MNRFKRYSQLCFAPLAALALLAGWPLATAAQTADGQTPAEETVCDAEGLDGAAWGLCNAYCEAMDCDSDAPKASETACAKVGMKFADRTGAMPPCAPPPPATCPCFDEAEISAALTQRTPHSCGVRADSAQIWLMDSAAQLWRFGAGSNPNVPFTCFQIDESDRDPNIQLSITAEEEAACIDEIVSAIAANNLQCDN